MGGWGPGEVTAALFSFMTSITVVIYTTALLGVVQKRVYAFSEMIQMNNDFLKKTSHVFKNISMLKD